jgi:menaquinone-specific isochorismate synthase
LRSGELDAGDARHIRLFAGCGIVADSDPVDELEESNVKFVPMRDALDH